MQHSYFISYARIPDNGGGFGFGNTVLTVDGPMTPETYSKLHDYLQERTPGYLVIVLSFQRLEAAEATASV